MLDLLRGEVRVAETAAAANPDYYDEIKKLHGAEAAARARVDDKYRKMMAPLEASLYERLIEVGEHLAEIEAELLDEDAA